MTVTFTPDTWTNGVTGLSAARMNNLNTTLNTVCGSINRSATFVVAASNSTTAEKAAADYVCDGTADESEINTAINAAAALSATGGTVQLLGGLYVINAQIRPKSNITLQGVGAATVIQPSVGMTTATAMIWNYSTSDPGDTGIHIRDMTIDGNRASVSNTHHGIYLNYAQYCRITNIDFINMNLKTVYIGSNTSAYNVVENCRISGHNNTGIDSHGPYSRIVNNIINGVAGTANTGIGSLGDYTDIIGNIVIGCAAGIVAGNYGSVVGNVIKDCQTSGIYALSAQHLTITANTVYNTTSTTNGYGIQLNTCTNSVVSNNAVKISEYQGIWLNACSNCMVSGNTLSDNGWHTDNTYAQIQADNACSRCTIIGNQIRRGIVANKAKYGVYIVAGCNNLLVVHNDLYDSGSTAALQDGGTATVTTLSGNQTT